MTLREIMTTGIYGIKNDGWLDYCFERGDYNAKSFSTYEDWLNSLSDEEFLCAYNRVKGAENNI